MNRRTLALAAALGAGALGVAVFFSAPALVQSQALKEGDKEDKHVLTVSGTGTVRVAPDSARLFFTVESYADQIRAARTDNASKVQKVMKALLELKIDGLKSKSDNLTVQQLLDHNAGHQLPRVVGYHITNSFTVLVENGDRAKLSADASRVLDAVLENGGTGVSQIVFFKKGADAARLQREAMTKAVEDALANGRALLAGMDKTKLEPLTVAAEPHSYAPAGRLQNFQNTMLQTLPSAGGPGSDDATALSAGELQYTYHVTVTCKY